MFVMSVQRSGPLRGSALNFAQEIGIRIEKMDSSYANRLFFERKRSSLEHVVPAIGYRLLICLTFSALKKRLTTIQSATEKAPDSRSMRHPC